MIIITASLPSEDDCIDLDDDDDDDDNTCITTYYTSFHMHYNIIGVCMWSAFGNGFAFYIGVCTMKYA